MTIIELKEHLLNNTLDDNLLIFVYEENTFIIKEYIKRICENKDLTLNLLESEDDLYEILNDAFGYFRDFLNVLYIDDLKYELPKKLKNCIIVCNKLSKEQKDKCKDFVIEFPKLENWQIDDYAKVKLTGLSEQEYKWLCSITKYDIYRLDNEINKISIFPKNRQRDIFKLLVEEDCYSDLTEFNIFSLTNAILKRSIKDVDRIMQDLKLIGVEPIKLVSILLKQFKYVIDIQTDKTATASTLNVSQKQFNAIKYNCGKFSNKELLDIYQLLLSIDCRLKSGLLDSDLIIDYVICNIMR